MNNYLIIPGGIRLTNAVSVYPVPTADANAKYTVVSGAKRIVNVTNYKAVEFNQSIANRIFVGGYIVGTGNKIAKINNVTMLKQTAAAVTPGITEATFSFRLFVDADIDVGSAQDVKYIPCSTANAQWGVKVANTGSADGAINTVPLADGQSNVYEGYLVRPFLADATGTVFDITNAKR